MSDAPSAKPTPRARIFPPRRIPAVIGSALALTAIIFGLILSFPDHAKAAPGGDIHAGRILAIDLAEPAIVRIEFTYQQIVATVDLCPGVTESIHEQPISGLGSGAFISSHGDILTAGHVIDPPQGAFDAFVLQDLAPQIASDLQTKCHIAATPDAVVAFYTNNSGGFSVTYDSPLSKVWLDTSYVGTYSEAKVHDVTSYPLTVTAKSTYQKNDVAIIHVNLNNTLSVPIGNSDDVAPTDTLTILGYPGNGDINHFNSPKPTDFLTESINQVFVSAIKTNDNGGTIIQVGGNVEHGDSGGPALNAQGQIVGVVSFGGQDIPAGTSFFQATSSVAPLLAQAGVDTKPGAMQTQWHTALTDYASTAPGHWHKAVADLTALQTNYPQFKGVKKYLDFATQQAQTEADVSQPLGLDTNTLIGAGLGGLAVILLLTLIIVLVSSRRRSRKKAALAAAEAQKAAALANSYSYGYGAPGGYNAPGGYGPPTNQPPTNMSVGWMTPTTPPSAWQPPTGVQPGSQWPQTPVATATASRPLCVNGHPMQPHEVYCGICGATRAQR